MKLKFLEYYFVTTMPSYTKIHPNLIQIFTYSFYFYYGELSPCVKSIFLHFTLKYLKKKFTLTNTLAAVNSQTIE